MRFDPSTPPSPSPRSRSACSSAGASATSSTSRSAAARASPPFIFYEGPPTANGRPGSHHVLAACSRTSSRATRRCAATTSTRKAGWDCHGLPVELEIERELGFHNKHDIERFGIAEFNARCRESVLRYIDEWNELTERIGFWIDTDDAYFTLDERLHRVGLVVAQAGLGEGPARRGQQGRARTARAAARRCPRTRWRSATRTSSTRRSTCASRWWTSRTCRCSPGRPCRGRSSRTPRSRWTRTSTYVRARHGRRHAHPGRGARASACSARTPRSSRG